MHSVRTVLLAGAAALGIAGLTGLALAAGPSFHVMTIQLPGGGVEHIQYTGNAPPKVVFASGPAFPFFAAAWGSPFWGPESPFAELDRVSAMMDRQMAAMMRDAQTMQPDGLYSAVMKDAPPGASSYSFVTTMSGNGFCSRSVQITSSPNGGKPQVVSHTSGNCGGATTPSLSATPSQTSEHLQTISFKPVHPAKTSHQGI